MAPRRAGLLVRRGLCRGRSSVAPSARSRGGDGRRLRPRRWSAGGLFRGRPGKRWEWCQAPFRDEKRARHRSRVLSTRRGAGRASQAQCRARHAPKSARGPRARDVGWGWPHLQSRRGSGRVSGEERLLTWRSGAPVFRSTVWGRASRLPISLVAGGVACPRGGGAFSQAGDHPRGVASRGAGLLVRRGWCRGRPSVAPSARSLGGGLKDCDRADGAPAACLAAGADAPERCTAGVAPLDVFRPALVA